MSTVIEKFIHRVDPGSLSGMTFYFSGLLGAIFLYIFSFIGAQVSIVNSIGWVVVVALTIFLYSRSISLGTTVLLTELVAGSLGRLFILPPGISVRMGIFAVALVATAIHCARSVDARTYLKTFPFKKSSLFLLVIIAWGTLLGAVRHRFGLVLSDANAYAYLFLLPTFLLALRKETDREKLFSSILGAVTGTAVLTLFLLFLFTHQTPEPILRVLYKWVRDFGMGEITRAPGGFYRVFFQAHFWSFVVFLWTPALLQQKKQWWIIVSSIAAAAVLFISFSRTFWLSAFLACACGVLLVLIHKKLRPNFWKYLATLILVSVLGIALPFILTRSVSSAAFARVGAVTGEAAADSRMNLLPVMLTAIQERPIFGWGFGKELTYVTKDPRLLAYFPDGNYTTTAFEWGWIDFWLKMGIFGLVAFLLLILLLLKSLWQSIRLSENTSDSWLSSALFVSIIGVSIAHMFSPWLNHPLGIGFLLFSTIVFLIKDDTFVKTL